MSKTSLQAIAEKILEKHGIDINKKGDFHIKLQKPNDGDVVIERSGGTIFVGHYTEQNGDLISDPVIVFHEAAPGIIPGAWFPNRIEQIMGDTPISEIEDNKVMISRRNYTEFKSFQAMFARNIKAQGWLTAEAKTIQAQGAA